MPREAEKSMPTPFHLATIVRGRNAQGLYADDVRGLTVFVLDYDNLCEGGGRLAQKIACCAGTRGRARALGGPGPVPRGRGATARALAADGEDRVHQPGTRRDGDQGSERNAPATRPRDRDDAAEIHLPIRWTQGLQPVGPHEHPEGHLLGTNTITGVFHHIEAFEVEECDGCQKCVLGEDDTNFAELSEIAQGPMRMVQIRGRFYVLLVTPFQD
jgi:hypothetical protein